MVFGLGRRISNMTGRKHVAVAGLLAAMVFAAWAIAGSAVEGEDTASQQSLEYIEREIFEDDPFSKQGNVSEVINAWSRHLEPGETLVGLVERNFELVAEFRRHRESDGPMTQDAYEINRYYLDPDDTDYKKVYKRSYRENILTFSSYSLVINVFTKRGETEETVKAFLRFNCL